MLKVYDTSLAVIAQLRPVLVDIERRDSDLGRQLRRALASVTLNISEGSYARGRNRPALYQAIERSRDAVESITKLGIDRIDVPKRLRHIERSPNFLSRPKRIAIPKPLVASHAAETLGSIERNAARRSSCLPSQVDIVLGNLPNDGPNNLQRLDDE